MLLQSRPCGHRWCGRRGLTASPRPPPPPAAAARRVIRGTATTRRQKTRPSLAAAATAAEGDDDADAAALLHLASRDADIPSAWAAAARRAHVAVVLVEPQIAENIGSAARAMRNFGIRPGDANDDGSSPRPHLRLVRPRDGFPPPQLASDVACGGADLIASAAYYDSLEAALADRHVVYAATARARRQAPRALSSRSLARDFARRCAAAEDRGEREGDDYEEAEQQKAGGGTRQKAARVALVFGRESSGLTNEEVGRAHAVVEVDAAPEYPVLNLGAAVSALAYELWRVRRPRMAAGQQEEQSEETEEGGKDESSNNNNGNNGNGNNRAAESGKVDALLNRLYAALDTKGFFTERSKRPSVERSLAALLRRVEGLGERDLALLHGALTALSSSSSSSHHHHHHHQQQQQQQKRP